MRAYIGKFLAYSRSRQNLQVKVFRYSTYSTISCLDLLQPTCNSSRPFKNKIFSCHASEASIASISSSWKESLRPFKLSFNLGKACESNNAISGGQRGCLSISNPKSKHFWITFRVLSPQFFS